MPSSSTDLSVLNKTTFTANFDNANLADIAAFLNLCDFKFHLDENDKHSPDWFGKVEHLEERGILIAD